jgi:chromate transporter
LIRDLWWYFLRLGATGFGGPIALVGYMQRDLVEERGWLTEAEYSEGLAFAQLAPGPLAAQLAMYIGWLRGGVRGATVSGVAFVAPSFVMVLALSAIYVRAGGLPWMRQAFYGIGAAVIAIIARSAYKLVRVTLRRDALLWGICAVNVVVTARTESEVIWVILASGALIVAARRTLGTVGPGAAASSLLVMTTPPLLMTGLAAPTSIPLLGRVFVFFLKGGALVFGSGLAIVPFLYGGAVEQYGWLTDRQFLDAVAVSMITPGPVVISVAFIGYLVAGGAGAIVASVGVFLPVYLSVVLLAPSFRRYSSNVTVRAFVDGVTAAATGAIIGAAVVLGRRAIIDVTTAVLAIVALVLLMRVRRIPEPLVIVAAGVVGMVL